MSKITINPVTRVEGDSQITLNLNPAGQIEGAQFSVQVFRGFERFLVGAPIEMLPQMTARLCGICYTAHILTSCKALENALEIKISPEARRLRELLHLGNFIESHTLSIAALSLPDFVTPALSRKDRNIGFLLAHSDLARQAMKLRQFGSMITKLAGKRPIHPVTPVIGGLLQPLRAQERDELIHMLDGAQTTVAELWQFMWNAFRASPEIKQAGAIESAFMSMRGEQGIEFYDADLAIVDKQGAPHSTFPAVDYSQHVTEEEREYSYMKFPVLKDGTRFRVGPLARVNVCGKFSTPQAQKMLIQLVAEYPMPIQNSLFYHLTRIAELTYAIEKAGEILQDPCILSNNVKPGIYHARDAHGVGIVEAPRGTLVHIYDMDAAGCLKNIRLYVATQHNNFAINDALTETAKRIAGVSNEETTLNKLEMIIRAYDPCLSCATH